MLNVEPSNLVFLQSCNTAFGNIIIKLTDQIGRLLEIEDKVNLRLFVNKEKWNILQNQEQENISMDIDFCYL